MKINIGSGRRKIDGYINMDGLDWDGLTDIKHDMTKYPYPFENETVDEILMVEVLEHIPFKETLNVLNECNRILKEGGKLHIQVPDIAEMIFAYWNGQICDCVPHKPKDKKDAMADLNCPKCKGYGRVHPNRWLYSFLGCQKHEFDAHLNIFTPERLKSYLYQAGFNDFDIGKDDYGWKIKANIYK